MNLADHCLDMAKRAKQASQLLSTISSEKKDRWLLAAADSLDSNHSALLEANAKDVEEAKKSDLSSAMIDRLRLTPARIQGMSEGLRQVAALPDPIGRVREGRVRPNGLEIQKISVPLGVIFFLYESRPNVTVDAAGLCVKSGNAVILRGGKEAIHSNEAIYRLLREMR